jgi:hypothetical protein
LLIAAASLGAINDPGAGLATRAERRTARVTQWQTQYEGLTAEQIQNQARLALYDIVDADCVRGIARNKMGDPQATDSTVDEWIEDRMSALASTDRLDLLETRCPGGTTTEEEQDQGGVMHKTLVIRGTAVADGIRSMLPVFPRVGGVSPLAWGTMAEATECTVGGVTGPCYASRHPWHEAHLHLLESIIRAEGRETNFALVDNLSEVDWQTPTP